MTDGLVWYASYGSNMDAARFGCYLAGGTPAGALRAQPGARDSRPPAADRPVWLSGGVYFAGQSSTWRGGVAFYDPELPGSCPARAYLITAEQFTDVAAQEMHRDPGGLIDMETLLRNGKLTCGPGGYETVLSLGALDGTPLVTFTAPWPAHSVPGTAPSAAYLRTLAVGLHVAHGWDGERIGGHLAALPGAAGHWTADGVAALIALPANDAPQHGVRPETVRKRPGN